jgi:hypothetical protein
MIARAIVHTAIRDVLTARGGVVPAALADSDSLAAVDPRVRLVIVERIEVAIHGHVSARLGHAHQARTVGELVDAVEQATARSAA